MTRQERLDWCKKRALEYIDQGNMVNAISSMGSDLNKHPDTKDHPAMLLLMLLYTNGMIDTPEEFRKYIEGFN